MITTAEAEIGPGTDPIQPPGYEVVVHCLNVLTGRSRPHYHRSPAGDQLPLRIPTVVDGLKFYRDRDMLRCYRERHFLFENVATFRDDFLIGPFGVEVNDWKKVAAALWRCPDLDRLGSPSFVVAVYRAIYLGRGQLCVSECDAEIWTDQDTINRNLIRGSTWLEDGSGDRSDRNVVKESTLLWGPAASTRTFLAGS